MAAKIEDEKDLNQPIRLTLTDADGPGDVEYVTVSVARAMLGCSKVVMARLVSEGALPTKPDKLDKRIKWVRRTDVESLKQQSPAASSQNGAGEAKRSGQARVTRKVA